MSEQRPLHEGQRHAPRDIEAIAEEFDRLSQQRSPTLQDYVIASHHSRPESFRWFLAGVLYERQREK